MLVHINKNTFFLNWVDLFYTNVCSFIDHVELFQLRVNKVYINMSLICNRYMLWNAKRIKLAVLRYLLQFFMCISITNYSLFNGLTLVRHHKKIELRIGSPSFADNDILLHLGPSKYTHSHCGKPRNVYIYIRSHWNKCDKECRATVCLFTARRI